MQFSLLTLLILMAVVCVFCASLNVPAFFSVPIYCCLAWLAPAYWVVGTVYSEGSRRAFYIGGLTATVAPYIVLTFMCVVFVVDGPGPWRLGRRYSWDDNIMTNLAAAFYLFMPVAATFLGGWLGYGVYFLVRKPRESPAQPTPTTGMFPAADKAGTAIPERSV